MYLYLYLYLCREVIPRYMFEGQRESNGKAEHLRIGSSVKCNTQHHGIQSKQTEDRKNGIKVIIVECRECHTIKRKFIWMRRKLSTNIHKLLYDVKWFNIVWHLPAKNKFDFWWLMRKRQWTCTRQERVTAHINMMSPFEKTVNDLTVFTHYFNSLRWRTTMFSVATQSVGAKEGEPILPMPAANIHCWCLPAD